MKEFKKEMSPLAFVQHYPILLQEEDEGCFSTSVPDLKGCFSQGNTLSEAMANTREAIVNWIKAQQEKKEEIPLPNSADEKDVFVLLADFDGCMRSVDEPFGVAISSESEAKKFTEMKNFAYGVSYTKVRILSTLAQALEYYKKNRWL